MDVVLAGFNVDTGVLADLVYEDAREEYPDKVTPEVLSAAYARISRDPRPVGELRAVAVNDVEKARKLNQNVIFGMGHASVAEHAVFNFDISNISRLAIEYLESHRLCSYTEKSQRYCRLGEDFVMPHELPGQHCHREFADLIESSSRLYKKFFPLLLGYFQAHKPNASLKLQEGWAKEDARYVSLLATSGQLGLTASARNLELIIRRCAASNIWEVRDLGHQLFMSASAVAPSLFRHVEPAPFDRDRYKDIRWSTQRLLDQHLWEERLDQESDGAAVRLIGHTYDPDERLCEALLQKAYPEKPHGWSRKLVSLLRYYEKFALVKASLRHLEFYDAVPREFEHVGFTFELEVSASCFAQLKRHRMMTLTTQPYDPLLDPTVPVSIKETGLEQDYLDHCTMASDLYHSMAANYNADIAEYALTNGHKRRVQVTLNLRELYHFARMRLDVHAQWDIWSIAAQMVEQVSDIAPLGAILVCGKDAYIERVKYAYDAEWAKQKKLP